MALTESRMVALRGCFDMGVAVRDRFLVPGDLSVMRDNPGFMYEQCSFGALQYRQGFHMLSTPLEMLLLMLQVFRVSLVFCVVHGFLFLFVSSPGQDAGRPFRPQSM
jgi:hypothetical protein